MRKMKTDINYFVVLTRVTNSTVVLGQTMKCYHRVVVTSIISTVSIIRECL